LREICASYGVWVVENLDWAKGMSTSVRAGLRACSPEEAHAAVIALADQPLVGAEAVEKLVRAFKGGAKVAVATYGGEPRNPVLFAHEIWSLLERELSGDEGARVVLRRHPELVTEVPCDDVADPADVDTVEDLRRLEELWLRDVGRWTPRRFEVLKLENEFTVDTPVEEAWKAMRYLEKVTPCLPGAQLTEQVGDEYKGTMTVKLGPVRAKYDGTVKIDEADEEAHRAVIKAEGKDARGQGTASATITSMLHEENGGDSTRVHVETDMRITGRVAQFGGGMHQEVAEKIMGRFAECLENELF